jgi:hypothetical protein
MTWLAVAACGTGGSREVGAPLRDLGAVICNLPAEPPFFDGGAPLSERATRASADVVVEQSGAALVSQTESLIAQGFEHAIHLRAWSRSGGSLIVAVENLRTADTLARARWPLRAQSEVEGIVGLRVVSEMAKNRPSAPRGEGGVSWELVLAQVDERRDCVIVGGRELVIDDAPQDWAASTRHNAVESSRGWHVFTDSGDAWEEAWASACLSWNGHRSERIASWRWWCSLADDHLGTVVHEVPPEVEYLEKLDLADWPQELWLLSARYAPGGAQR